MPSFEPTPLPGAVREEFVAQPFAAVGPHADGVASPAGGARETREQIRQHAYQEGRAAGRAELPWSEAEQLRSAAAACEEAARGLAGLQRTYLRAHRRAVIDLALAVAEKLLGRAVEADPDALVGVMERALEAMDEIPATRVRLSPRDCEVLERGLAPELARIASEHGVAVEPDPALAPGDIRVLGGITEVDARLSQLLHRVREGLAEAIEVDPSQEES